MSEAFAAYGTLGPGKPNHEQVSDIPGTWSIGRVRGRLVAEGWGADLGFPGIVLGDGDEWVTVDLLESDELAEHWSRLDDFEGPGYRRVRCDVLTDSRVVSADIYELSELR